MQSRATMSLASAAGSSADIPTHRSSGEPIPTSEQLMQVDQAITLTLQEIDANFARCHQTITGKILPSIRRYGVASHNTWQGSRFWHRFFETASDINLVPAYEGEGETDMSQEPTSSSFTSQDQEASTSLAGLLPRRAKAVNEGEEDDDSSGIVGGEAVGIDDSGEFHERDFDEPPRLSEASMAATQRLRQSEIDDQGRAAWAPVESPFERLKREVDSDFSAAAAAGQERHLYGGDMNDKQLAQDIVKLPSMRDRASTTPKRAGTGGSRLAAQVLKNQHEQILKSAMKVQATPRRGGTASGGNPFAVNGQPALKAEANSKWNGTADLRKTPLAKIQVESRKGKQAVLQDNGDYSFEGLSPMPPTQSSLPQRKFVKTPAQATSRLALDDLLRTLEGASPATRRTVMQRIGGNSDGSLTSTPLRKGPVKGRKSLPTPPTVTKRMDGTTILHRGGQGSQSPAQTSSARLFDEDEDGVDDEDSEEDESESDEEDNAAAHATGRIPAVQSSKNGSDYPTNSSLASNSRSIDQDTLFGIRDPHKAAPTPSASSLHKSTKFSSSSDAPTLSSSPTDGSSNSYQPINHRLYEQGTVYGGRPLLNDDREDTFSAPSPTPATSQARRSK